MNATAQNQIGFKNLDQTRCAREVFQQAEFSEEGLQQVLGTNRVSFSKPGEMTLALRKTADETPLNTLIRLFELGVHVTVDSARRTLAPMSLESWVNAGLIDVRNHEVVPRVKIVSSHDLLIASDQLRKIRGTDRSDFVVGVGNCTSLTASITIRRRCNKTLDLGTGCGILGLLCSGHSDHVLATDKNPRAVEFTRFNAALNGIENLEGLTGDLFEPVQGQQFDHVVTNPPYVITPTARYLFRDSGMRGDEFCRNIIQHVPEFLIQGGFCQLVCNCGYGAGDTWQDCLKDWFEGTGCDVFVWGGETQDASQYATTWIRDTESHDEQEFAKHYDRWMDYYEQHGLEAFSYCLVTMRRNSGRSNWVKLEEMPERFAGPAGGEIVSYFETQDYLNSLEDESQLLKERLCLSPETRIDLRYQPTPDGLAIQQTKIHRVQGAVFNSLLDTNVTGLVQRCDGKRTLRELFQETAHALDTDIENLIPGGLVIVKRLLERGFLVRSSEAPKDSTG